MIGRASSRWLTARVSLFFLAAIVWLAGVIKDDQMVRWVAMGIAFIALLVGIGLRIAGGRDVAPSDPDG